MNISTRSAALRHPVAQQKAAKVFISFSVQGWKRVLCVHYGCEGTKGKISVPVHDIETYRASRDITPFTFNLGT